MMISKSCCFNNIFGDLKKVSGIHTLLRSVIVRYLTCQFYIHVISFFYWDTVLHYVLYLWMQAYLIFPPMLLNWSLKQIDNSQITLRGASVT